MSKDKALDLALEALILKTGMNPVMQGICYVMHPEALQAVIDEAIKQALAAQQDIQRLSALVRAQQITIDKLEAQRQSASSAWVGLKDEMVTAAARALNKRQAEACGVDKNDHWKFYGDDIKEDARAALEAAHSIKEKNT
jgi:hypothetical protein